MGRVIVKRDTPRQCFARLELNNGDQVMISLAQAEVTVVKMNWAGMLPGPTLWKSASGAEIAQKFFDETKLPQRLIDAVIDRVIDCRGAADVVVRLSAKPDDVLTQYVATLGKAGHRVIRDVSKLPYPKDLIKSVLRQHLKNVSKMDKKAINAMEAAYVSLSSFQPLTIEEREAVPIMEGPGDTLTVERVRHGDVYHALLSKCHAEGAALLDELHSLSNQVGDSDRAQASRPQAR
jgi:hypothetical protein